MALTFFKVLQDWNNDMVIIQQYHLNKIIIQSLINSMKFSRSFGLKLKCGGIHAIAQAGWFRAIFKNMAQMGIAPRT